MVRLDRIELSTPAWKAEVLPQTTAAKRPDIHPSAGLGSRIGRSSWRHASPNGSPAPAAPANRGGKVETRGKRVGEVIHGHRAVYVVTAGVLGYFLPWRPEMRLPTPAEFIWLRFMAFLS